MPDNNEFMFEAGDGVRLLGRRWLPEAHPRAIVEIAHGLAVHSTRYAGLAAALNGAGCGVYSMDLRGHGAPPRPRGTSAISPTPAAGQNASAT